MQSKNNSVVLSFLLPLFLLLSACQSPAVNTESDFAHYQSNAGADSKKSQLKDDPDLTLAAGPQIAGPEASKDEELAFIPETTPIELEVEHGLFAKLPGSEYKRSWKSKGKNKHIGSMGYSRLGALNFLVAEKKIKTLTAIRPKWGQSRIINPGVIEPTSKVVKIIK